MSCYATAVKSPTGSWANPLSPVLFGTDAGLRLAVFPNALIWPADLGAACIATRQIQPIVLFADFAGVREAALAEARSALLGGALAAIAAFDSSTWRQVQFCLLPTVPETVAKQIYAVGHVARWDGDLNPPPSSLSDVQ